MIAPKQVPSNSRFNYTERPACLPASVGIGDYDVPSIVFMLVHLGFCILNPQWEKRKTLTLKSKKRPVLLGEELVLVDLSATAFCGIAGAFLPFVRNDHLRQLLLACSFQSK